MRGGATQVLLSVWAKILAAVLALDADAQTARLRVAQRGAAADLEILLLARAPCLDVAALNLQVGQIAGAAFERADRDIQLNGSRSTVFFQRLVIPHHGILRLADDDHLLLLELMDAVHAALFDAVRADFLAEARRIAGQRLRQLVLR